MAMYFDGVCPKCGKKIDMTKARMFDTYFDKYVATLTRTAKCEDCGVAVYWDEVFSYIGFDNVEVDDDD